MKVWHLTSVYGHGGAAKIVASLNHELNLLNYQSKIIAGKNNGNSNDALELKRTLLHRIFNNRFINSAGIFNQTVNEINKLGFNRQDVLHLHNIHGAYLNLFQLPKLFKHANVVWTLHDPWLIQDYGLTPEYAQIFRDSYLESRGRKILRQEAGQTKIVVPSNWLKSIVNKLVPNLTVEVIYNGIDTNIYFPINKIKSKIKLNIPPQKKIILVAAKGTKKELTNSKKVLSLIQERFQNYIILALGGKNFIQDENLLNLYYNAADVLVYPSEADNFPLMVIEAMSVGLPVVAYNVGGVSEAVLDGQSGLLVKKNDKHALLNKVESILNFSNEHITNMSSLAQERAKSLFSLKKMVNAYIQIYEREY